MLRDLHIQNLAVVEDVAIEFGDGLNVLTGATGAGKSIVVDSLALLAGGRARTDLIRSGADLLTVTGVFDPLDGAAALVLEEAGVATDDGGLHIRREISREGRNRVFVNDRPVTLRLLSELAPFLLRIHTQREELGLVSPELQRFWVDRSGGEKARELLEATRERFDAWESLSRKWSRMAGDERMRLERIDLLRFQREEIDVAGLTRGEEVELAQRRDQLRHREAIQNALGTSFGLLFDGEGSAVEEIAQSRRLIADVEEWEPEATEWRAELEEAAIRIDEVSKAIRGRLDSAPTDPAEIDGLESRLAAIDRLSRKYGASSTDILEYREAIDAELSELEGDEEDRAALEGQIEAALEEYAASAEKLSKARQRWGRALAKMIEAELADLAMEKATLAVEVDTVARADSPLEVGGRAVEFGPHGHDRVIIVLQANPGEQVGPVAKVASGGELSRVYLALQLAAGESAMARPTLIFDEVDSGVGGSEAAALGHKLRRLSDGGQILAVTHLPQVASCGHRHYQIRKADDGARTKVSVEGLDAESRVEEVARMLAGEKVTRASRSHAEELIAAGEVS